MGAALVVQHRTVLSKIHYKAYQFTSACWTCLEQAGYQIGGGGGNHTAAVSS